MLVCNVVWFIHLPFPTSYLSLLLIPSLSKLPSHGPCSSLPFLCVFLPLSLISVAYRSICSSYLSTLPMATPLKKMTPHPQQPLLASGSSGRVGPLLNPWWDVARSDLMQALWLDKSQMAMLSLEDPVHSSSPRLQLLYSSCLHFHDVLGMQWRCSSGLRTQQLVSLSTWPVIVCIKHCPQQTEASLSRAGSNCGYKHKRLEGCSTAQIFSKTTFSSGICELCSH